MSVSSPNSQEFWQQPKLAGYHSTAPSIPAFSSTCILLGVYLTATIPMSSGQPELAHCRWHDYFCPSKHRLPLLWGSRHPALLVEHPHPLAFLIGPQRRPGSDTRAGRTPRRGVSHSALEHDLPGAGAAAGGPRVAPPDPGVPPAGYYPPPGLGARVSCGNPGASSSAPRVSVGWGRAGEQPRPPPPRPAMPQP